MRLKSLYLKNIACFEDFTLDLSDPDKPNGEPLDLCILIGDNGIGKSVLLESLVAWANGMASSTYRPAIESLHRRGTSDAEIQPAFRLKGQDRIGLPLLSTLQEEVSQSGRVPSIKRSKAARLPQNRGMYGLSEPQSATKPVVAIEDMPFCYWETQRDIEIKNHVTPVGELLKSKGYDRGERRSEIVRMWLAHEHESAAKVHGKLIPKPVETLGKALSTLRGHPVYQTTRRTFSNTVETEFKNCEGLSVTDADLSGGERHLFVMFAWLLLQVPRDPAGPKPIILIDEIETHLHPNWQQGIFAGLRALMPGSQIICTTHSPYVIESPGVELKNVFRLRRREPGEGHASE